MSKFRQITLASLITLITLSVTACGGISPTGTPAPKNTPLPVVTPTLENTPSPTLTSTKSPTSTPTVKGSIDIGGYKLLYQCFGQGTPTVIVEAGGGDRPTVSRTWSAVTQAVQNTTRICIYNRVAGVRTSQKIAEDLHYLLSQIPVSGPYILVGHSIGGYHVRVFAHLYPEDTAGLILVDTTVSEAAAVFATAYPTYSPNESTGITNYRVADVNALPTPDIDGLDFNTSAGQVLEAGSVGNIPLVVISANHGAETWSVPGFTAEDTERMTAAMFKTQSDLAKLSSKGVFIIANTSDHFVSLHDPQTIIDAIVQMVEDIRNQ